MIIPDTLKSLAVDGDNMIFNHAVDASAELALAQRLRQNNDGNWTDSREMRLVGSIHPLAYHKLMKEKPEIAKDAKKLIQWLYHTEEGQIWKTNTALDTGRSGKVIVK